MSAFAAIALAQLIEDVRPTWVILAEVAAKHGLTIDDLKRRDPKRRCAWPRQEAMWRLRHCRLSMGERRFSMSRIGTILGGLDHTTVSRGIAAHETRLQGRAG